jgi:hypothetical protein
MERVNLIKIYCEHICKCHNESPLHNYYMLIKKKKRKKIFWKCIMVMFVHSCECTQYFRIVHLKGLKWSVLCAFYHNKVTVLKTEFIGRQNRKIVV